MISLPKLFKSTVFLSLLALHCNAQDFSKVDAWLKDHTSEMGGRSYLMIYKDGKIVYSNGMNEMNRRQKAVARIVAQRTGKDPNTEDFTSSTRQPIASCSKWLSAALVMTFIDEGKLKLTDTIGKFLPIMTANGKGNITIEQCLSHRTGIKAADLRESIKEMKEISSMDEAIFKIATLPMEGEPGKVFHYSNAGLQIAGAVIEKISGKSFETLFAQRIAKPLEMKNTDFGKEKVALPAGGAYSTPEDYLHFLEMIVNKGKYKGKTILSQNSIVMMQINRITPDVRIAYTPAEAGDAGYGFGEWVPKVSDGNAAAKFVSSPGLFGSFPLVDNEKHYAVFLMCYYVRSEGRGERYKELQELVDEAATVETRHALSTPQ
jgi:CubicO group peptidase (beta-lactamase class C family)